MVIGRLNEWLHADVHACAQTLVSFRLEFWDCVLPVCACVFFNTCGERKREYEESCTHTHGRTGRMRVCM